MRSVGRRFYAGRGAHCRRHLHLDLLLSSIHSAKQREFLCFGNHAASVATAAACCSCSLGIEEGCDCCYFGVVDAVVVGTKIACLRSCQISY